MYRTHIFFNDHEIKVMITIKSIFKMSLKFVITGAALAWSGKNNFIKRGIFFCLFCLQWNYGRETFLYSPDMYWIERKTTICSKRHSIS